MIGIHCKKGWLRSPWCNSCTRKLWILHYMTTREIELSRRDALGRLACKWHSSSWFENLRVHQRLSIGHGLCFDDADWRELSVRLSALFYRSRVEQGTISISCLSSLCSCLTVPFNYKIKQSRWIPQVCNLNSLEPKYSSALTVRNFWAAKQSKSFRFKPSRMSTLHPSEEMEKR